MSGLMRAAVTVATAIENEARPVMVHCSDGWDRTPQIVALAEILLDPYYRSLEVISSIFYIKPSLYKKMFDLNNFDILGISSTRRARMVRFWA
jgi:protein tyrosine/serine phosphatase